jgi:hypothetical protein
MADEPQKRAAPVARVGGLFRRSVLSLILFLSGCESPTSPSFTVVSHHATAAGPLTVRLSLRLDRPAALEVEYRADEGPTLRVVSGESRDHEILLARLKADRTYHYRVVGGEAEGSFRTDPLPTDLAAIEFAATGMPTHPLTLVHLFRQTGFRGYAVVDGGGDVVWYWRAEGYPYGASRRADGAFSFLDGDRGLVVVSPAGELLAELSQRTPAEGMHHDAIFTPSGSLLYIAFDPREFDGGELQGEAVWEWTPGSGEPVKRWSSWDHLSPDVDRGPRFGREWLHANSLAIGPRGNVLVSLHYLNQVLSIAPDWSGLEWRLGGVNATIGVSAADAFSGQHTARELDGSRVVLFDNGLDRRGPSRALELELRGSEAFKVWEWSPPQPNFSSAVSSARRLPDGGTLVAFGMSAGLAGATGPTEIYEVASDGTTRWHLLVSNVETMFRAEPLMSLTGEEVVAPDAPR